MPTLRPWLVPALLLAACAGSPRAGRPRAEPPRLVVLIVVDQLPSWSFTGRARHMRHGIGRLLREGAFWPEAAFPYASTNTAPGHAALSTGAPPSTTGILANVWFDREANAQRESIEDHDRPLLRIPGSAGTPRVEDGASPRKLRVDTVGDVLMRERPGAKVVGVALKDRGAILSAGRHPTIAIWYDSAQIAFTTSTWFAAEPPPWLVALANDHPIAPRLDEPWDLDEAARARVREISGGPDDGPGEASVDGLGIQFPHRMDTTGRGATALVATPFGNEIVVEAALAAVDGERLGADDVPDLLAISFSATDYVGHYWGQESWEAVDMLLRLDAQLEQLFAGLDARVGAGRWAAVLTSDHGVTRTIERSGRGRRVPPAEIEAAAERAAASVAGEGDWISAGRDPAIYLSSAARALPDDELDAVVAAVTSALLAIDGIGYAYPSHRACDAKEPIAALVCSAIDRERSGEIFFGPGEGSVIMRPPFEATAHGSANDEDRLVPVIVLAPGVAPGRRDERISTLRVAPTLAALLGVAPPPAAREPALDLATFAR
jgi:predicted AlkP superfamily pyrophosphatase or phosphodiesterase